MALINSPLMWNTYVTLPFRKVGHGTWSHPPLSLHLQALMMSQYHLLTPPNPPILVAFGWLKSVWLPHWAWRWSRLREAFLRAYFEMSPAYIYVYVYIYIYAVQRIWIFSKHRVCNGFNITLLHQLPLEELGELVPNKPAALLYNFIYLYVF